MPTKLLVGLVFILVSAASAASAASGSEILREQCYLLKSAGKKIGYICETQRRSGQNIITERQVRQKFRRKGNTLEFSEDQVFIEHESGQPLEFSYSSENIGEIIEITGKFDHKNNKILINSSVNHIKNIKETDINTQILFPFAINQLYKTSQDNTVNYSTIEPGINQKIIRITSTKISDNKYKIGMNIFPNAEIYEWRDENGFLTRSVTSIMDMEQIAVTKNEVLQTQKQDFDMFPESLIRVNRKISSPEKLTEVTYRVTSKNTPVLEVFQDCGNREVLDVQGDTAIFRIRPEFPETHPYPVSNKGFEEYLKSGPYIITDSPKIQNIAKTLSEGQTDALVLAKKASKWVYNNITNKNLAVDFANAVTILETRSGDCTEHSILLASILRAMGIPSKTTVGLVYTNDPEPAFVYHMWISAYIGEWISLDPSQPYEVFTPLHLAMAESPLNDISGKSELVIGVIRGFSDIKIEILNQSKPVTVKNSDIPQIDINLGNTDFLAKDNFININLNKPSPVKPGVQRIAFNTEGLIKNDIKTAFFNFTRGDTDGALAILQAYYDTIAPEDDFSKVRLALKLINMSYFNFAGRVLDSVREEEIWKNFIKSLYSLYFPKERPSEELERVQARVFCLINYENNPELALELLGPDEKFRGHDYINYLKALAYRELRNLEQAEVRLNAAIQLNPDNLTYRLELVNILSVQDKIREAQQQLSYLNIQAKRLNIRDVEFWNKFNTYNYWLKAREFRNSPALSRYHEANYYIIKGDLDTATDILNRLVYTSDEAYLHELLGEIYYELEQFDAAKTNYQRALAKDKNRIKSWIGLGHISFIHGDSVGAKENYNKALDISPSRTDTLLALAKLHGYLGNSQKALDYFKKILLTDKNNPDVLYNLGIILANGGRLEQAEKMLKKALSADPVRSLIWLDLGKLEFARKNYLEAAGYLQNIKYMDEDNPYYYYFMGLILNRNGQQAEAEEFFRKALQLKPELLNELKEANRL